MLNTWLTLNQTHTQLFLLSLEHIEPNIPNYYEWSDKLPRIQFILSISQKKNKFILPNIFLSRRLKKTKVSSQVSNLTTDCKLLELRYDSINLWISFFHRVPMIFYFHMVESPMEVKVFN